MVDRLLRKIRKSDNETNLRRALESASDLAQVRGAAVPAMAEAKEVLLSAGADQSAVARLSEISEMLSGQSDVAANIVLDFGMLRGLAYYNGIIFEVTHSDWPVPLGGGGRYDGLALALGAARPVPALGFAYNLDALIALTKPPETADKDKPSNGGTLVVSSNALYQVEAVNTAQDLRGQGKVAVLDVNGSSLEDAKALAARMGLGQVMMVLGEGRHESYEVEHTA